MPAPATPEPAPESVGVIVIHGVGETEPGWIDDHFLPHLQTADPGLVLYRHSRSIKLAAAAGDERFPVHLRDGVLVHGPDVHFMELFWADLSRLAGKSRFAETLASLRLFFEAPHVAAGALLPARLTGIDAALRRLILWAIAILRGPITGLNICFLAVGTALTQHVKLPIVAGLPPFAVAMLVLAGLAAISGAVHAFLKEHDAIWSDLARATGSIAVVLLAVFMTNPLHGLIEPQGTPLQYFWAFRPLLLGAWLAWAGLLLLAVVLIGLRQIFVRTRRADVTGHRFSGALAVAIGQSAFWLTVFPLLGAVTVNAALGHPADARHIVDPGLFFPTGQGEALSVAGRRAGEQLWMTFVFDLFCIAFVLMFVGASIANRRLALQRTPDDIDGTAERTPRLIVNASVVWAIIACAAVMAPMAITRLYPNHGAPVVSLILAAAPYAALIAYILWRVVDHVVGRSAFVTHIARDLVSHHSTANDRLGARLQESLGHKAEATRRPSRERIQERLAGVVAHMGEMFGPDRILFVAHSQGSVILLDHLKDAPAVRDRLGDARIDVLTLGSPIGHLYGHYFHEYDDLADRLAAARTTVTAWRNLHRIADPIAGRITGPAPDFPENAALQAGGHMDYWSDPIVCAEVMAMIRAHRPARNPAPPDPAATLVGVYPRPGAD